MLHPQLKTGAVASAGALFSPDPTSDVLQALDSVERKVWYFNTTCFTTTSAPLPRNALQANAVHAPLVAAAHAIHTPVGTAQAPTATPSSFWPTGGSNSNLPLGTGTILRGSRLGPAGATTSWGPAPIVGPHGETAAGSKRTAEDNATNGSKRARFASDAAAVASPTCTPICSLAALGTQADVQASQVPTSQVRPSQYWARLPQEEKSKLTTYLPDDLAEKYMPSSCNGGMLYEWQVRIRWWCMLPQAHALHNPLHTQADCLVMPGVLTGRNLVYTAPTGGGKTLVAEVLLMRRMLERQQRGCSSVAGMIVLPYNAVCREKVGRFGLTLLLYNSVCVLYDNALPTGRHIGATLWPSIQHEPLGCAPLLWIPGPQHCCGHGICVCMHHGASQQHCQQVAAGGRAAQIVLCGG